MALRCILNLASGGLTSVVVEWSTDYIATFEDRDPELVSVKHRDPGTGDWTLSRLREPLRDLHMVWRKMDERCTCAFVSSSGVSAGALKGLPNIEFDGVGAAERDRFLGVLSLPDPPLPRRSEMTTMGISAMSGALTLLGRDEQYAAECYSVLLRRIERAAVEEPVDPVERIARLTRSLRDRRWPDQEAQTLRIDDLRELVLATEATAARRTPSPIRSAVVVRDRGDREVEVGGSRFRLVGEPEEQEAPDGSYRLLRSSARYVTAPSREVRVTRLEILAETRKVAELRQEAKLHDTVAGLPRVLIRAETPHSFAFVTASPPGEPLPSAYGRPPCPRIALDMLVRALPQVARTLEGLHASGRAHRALRPEALIASRDRLWLRDAGLAATPAVAGEGPAEYRAPEQDRPILTPPGPASDVYQLAAIVYHLATGEPPGGDPPPPGLLRPELAPELEEPLLRALADEMDQRPALGEFVQALGATLRRGGTVRC
ncbi:hypothetical protein FHR83_004034 [Actinoplanes campanulatus]|uniref:Protein kinase domain-containing protein n=1 Tax=Actinoplanes campanulatus TaxID=113559 RepID=A0A7W5AI49_9ACTN|nr:hypothetical protein [Actinoplanes campanulatus]MBB3096364.1 hypothetical protein [Actinoplanes campanulatus]